MYLGMISKTALTGTDNRLATTTGLVTGRCLLSRVEPSKGLSLEK